MGVFSENAQKWVKIGLSPLPIVPGEKRPSFGNWQQYCATQPNDIELAGWSKKYANHNLGLALGTVIEEGVQLVAIDVDADDAVGFVRTALGNPRVSKRGKKGITFFMVASTKISNQKIKRFNEDGRPSPKPSVEILAKGSQTVLPPSIHPDGMEYSWSGDELVDPRKLTYLSDEMIDECVAWCHGKAEHFIALNEMTWLGEGGGGNTHDTCVSAVACMVARGWGDSSIINRVGQAKKEACERAGDSYDWPQADKIIQGWIDSARAKGMDSSAAKKRKPPAEREAAEWAIDNRLGGADSTATVNGILRSYRDGHWPEVNVPWLLREMYEHDPTIKEREAKAAVSIIATITDRPGFGRTVGIESAHHDPRRSRICLTNGTLDMRSGKLEQWDPDHELIHQLPFEWDDEAECKLYEKIVNQTFNGDKESIQLWDEYCAHTLVDDMTFQKLLFLRGPGGNGKGTIARVLRSMHDPTAVGSVAITDLNDERKRTSLVGKLVNISGEQSRLNLVSDTYLKKITGGDPIDVRRLYGEVKNNVTLSVRFLELVNEMPATSDNSYALRRRIIILDCPRKVAKPDVDLDRKLAGDRPGILKRWVRALSRLYKRGHFQVPEASEQETELYIQENNPVEIWLEEETVPLDMEAKGVASRELYAHFHNWAKTYGFRWVPSGIEWGRKMTLAGYPSKNVKLADGAVCKMRLVKIRAGREATV